mgnify:CR=1 FL=1
MSELHTLKDTPGETWGNTVLSRLAPSLGYGYTYSGDIKNPDRCIVADPDEVLEKALEIIREWRS